MDENAFLRDLAHFRLSNGSEIVCEIMEWPGDEGNDIIVRNGMAIVPADYEGERVYVFRPWMHYIENNDEYFIINANHIISTARPNEHLVRQYNYAVEETRQNALFREEQYKQEIKQTLDNLEEIFSVTKDSDSPATKSNIVSFPSKDDIIH